MATISKQEIIDALTRLGQLATEHGDRIELLLVGGSVMVLLFGTRESTKDVDAVILHPREAALVRQLARTIAQENGWPDDWLNDAVKGFLVGTGQAEVVFASAGITAWRPSLEQLLALKLCAWRDDVDIADARRLLQELPGAYNEVWRRVSVHLQPGRELKARYAFDDLWEESRGPA